MALLPDTAFRGTLIQAKAGQQAALSCLYVQFLPIISAYIAHHAPPAGREDLTSEVFMLMVRDIRTVRAENDVAFAAWLYTIARRVIADSYRKEQIVTVRMESVPGIVSADDPTERIELQEDLAALEDGFQKLSTEKKRVFIAHVNGEDITSLAIKLGKSKSTLRVMMHRILAFMRSHLPQTVVIATVFAMIMTMSYVFVANSRPGDLFYPVRQLVAPVSTPTPVSIPSIVPMPTQAPTPTPSPTPTPVPTSAPMSSGLIPPSVRSTIHSILPGGVCTAKICF